MNSHGFQSLTETSPKIYAVMNEEYEIKPNRGSLTGTVPMNSRVCWGQSL